LYPFEIAQWSSPHHTPALRAAIPSQKDLLRKTIKKGRDKSMTPDPTPLTPRAHLRLRPRKIPPLRNYLLDGNENREYHQNILL
jgi:hypothetical protein